MSLKLLLARAAAVAAGLSTATATAALLQFTIQATNQYGSLSEFGDTTINISLDPAFPGNPPGARFRCGSEGGFVQGPLIQLSAVVDLGAFSGCSDAEVNVGPLAAGVYSVTATVYESDGSTALVNAQVVIPARGAKCNLDPALNQLETGLANKTPDQFFNALATDPDYRSQFGNVAFTQFPGFPDTILIRFPPLDDPVRVEDRLTRTGEFTSISGEGYVCFAAPPPDLIARAVEYYNLALDHYFFTADAKEQQALDSGAVPGNWTRTGKSFAVLIRPGCPSYYGGRHPAYRFTGEPNIGPNSHFFTVSLDECAVVRDRVDWHWLFEGSPFWASEPVAGACPAGFGQQSQPLHRAYNNGKGGTPNHRYSTDQSVIDQMVAQGWVDEGIAMCVAGP